MGTFCLHVLAADEGDFDQFFCHFPKIS